MSNTATIEPTSAFQIAKIIGPLKAFPVTVAILLLSFVAYFIPSLTDAWQLSNTNSIWSLLTGHLTHWSFDQLFWDALAFGVLGYFCERAGRLRFIGLCLASSVAVSVAVLWTCPELQFYRGLSGIDSALFAFLACQIAANSFRNGDRKLAIAATVGWLLFVGKVSYEMTTSQTLFVESAGDFTALPISHVVGAVAGSIAWGVGAMSPDTSAAVS